MEPLPADAQLPQWARYCRKCHYPLAGLEHWICPECGTAFDPRREETFSRSARPRRWYEYAWALEQLPDRVRAAVLLGVLLVAGKLLIMLATWGFLSWLVCVLLIVYPIWWAGTIWYAMSIGDGHHYDSLLACIIIGVVVGFVLMALFYYLTDPLGLIGFGGLGMVVGHSGIGMVVGVIKARAYA